jgi:hypothetical protein
MRRIWKFSVLSLLIVGLVACGGGDSDDETASADDTESAAGDDNNTTTTEAEAEDGDGTKCTDESGDGSKMGASGPEDAEVAHDLVAVELAADGEALKITFTHADASTPDNFGWTFDYFPDPAQTAYGTVGVNKVGASQFIVAREPGNPNPSSTKPVEGASFTDSGKTAVLIVPFAAVPQMDDEFAWSGRVNVTHQEGNAFVTSFDTCPDDGPPATVKADKLPVFSRS